MAGEEGHQFKQFLQKFSRPNSHGFIQENPAASQPASRSPESERKILENGALPDYIQPDLDLLVVGINPGFFSAKEHRYYAGPNNHFWKCLYQSKLIPEPITWRQDFRLLEWDIGLTNICARATRGQADLSKKEITEGAEILVQKIKHYRPKIVVFNGKGIYEIFSGRKADELGRQPSDFTGVEIFVVPSSSPRSSLYPTAEHKVPFFTALREMLALIKEGIPLKTEQFRFKNESV